MTIQSSTSLPITDDELQLNLYDNAIDSIRHAVEHYSSADPVETRRYKYAILHLAQGVTLLLKERLSHEHPNFIFSNVVDSEKTVDMDQAINRLENIAKVDLGSRKELIQELARLRNRVEHYSININKRQAASIIARVVVFLIFFIRDELNRDFRKEIGEENWTALQTIEEYLSHAKREAEIRLKADGNPIFLCDVCQSNTATINKRHPNEPDRRKINYSVVTCLVCQKLVAYREECRGCGKEMLLHDPARLNWESYCSECGQKAREEFPKLALPTFAIEVKNFFQEHETITTEKLLELLQNVASLGSSRYTHVDQLIQQRVIDFVSDIDREAYHPGSMDGPGYEIAFKWIHDSGKADSSSHLESG